MKKIVLILTFFLTGLTQTLSAKNVWYELENETRKSSAGIKDGWYSATVEYTNYNTGTHATYTLNVKVEYNSVVKIDFGNGGSVHTGYNNEGYVYSGGDLYFKKDYYGNINAATATVSISDTNGIRVFEIEIE